MTDQTSPFVSVQSPDAYKVHNYQNGGMLSMSMDKLSNPVKTVDKLYEVEDFYLADADIPGEMIELTKDNPQSPVQEAQVNAVALSLAIMRAATNVAKLSRRGMGNVVLMHPETAKLLGVESPLPLAQIAPPKEPTTKGRWTLMGMLNYTLSIWTSTDIVADKVFVVYVGGAVYDQPTCRANGDQFDVYAKLSSADQLFQTLDITYSDQ